MLYSRKQKKKSRSDGNAILIIPPKGIAVSNQTVIKEKQAPDPVSEKTPVSVEVKKELERDYPVSKPISKPAFSIAKAISTKSSLKKEEAQIETQERAKDTVTDERLFDAWKKFAEKVKQEGKVSFFSTLIQRKPVLNGHKIVFSINNAVQKEDLHHHKTEMLDFLRHELNNFSIQLDWKMEISNTEAHLYTPMEKFNELAKKNPDLNVLRQTFDLDIDF